MLNSQHPSSAKTRISLVPDSEPLPPVVHPQPSTSESEYKTRLLSLYIAEVQQTGRIDYPELVQFLDQVYAVENASEGAQILPDICDILLQNLEFAQADILTASGKIQILLNTLADALAQKHLTDDIEQQVRSGIRQETQRFLKAAEYLLDTAEQHAVQRQFRFWKSRSARRNKGRRPSQIYQRPQIHPPVPCGTPANSRTDRRIRAGRRQNRELPPTAQIPRTCP